MSSGIVSQLGWVAAVGLSCYLGFLWSRVKRLSFQRDQLVQEKELVFDFMQDVTEVFSGTDQVDVKLLLRSILYYAMRTSRASGGAIYLYTSDGKQLEARSLSGRFPPMHAIDQSILQALNKPKRIEELVRTRPIARGEGFVGEVAKTGRAVLVEDADNDVRIPKHGNDLLKIDSILAVPMRFKSEVTGVIVVLNREDGRPLSRTDQNLLQALADQASVSLHHAGLRTMLDEKKRIDGDLDVARQIQKALLPHSLPHVEGVEIGAFNEPAMEIGGDYYDVIQVDDRHIGMAIADVSGKGIGGAIMMSICRSMLHAYAPGKTSPSLVLTEVNRAMSQDISEDMFVSMLYMILNTETRELTVTRAGHEKPILRSGNGTGFKTIESQGIAIGLADSETFEQFLEEKTLTLAPGDAIVAYTDGVTEAMNQEGEEWGLDKFLDSLRVAADEGVESIMNNVSQRLVRFVGDQPQYDDMTLLALRVLR